LAFPIIVTELPRLYLYPFARAPDYGAKNTTWSPDGQPKTHIRFLLPEWCNEMPLNPAVNNILIDPPQSVASTFAPTFERPI
jgi:hypothetical protein